MTQRIFKSILTVTGTILFISFMFIVGILYQHFDDEMLMKLENDAHYLSSAVEVGGIDYLKSLDNEQRITLIDTEGNVLFDNKADELKMENHLEREEIQEAIHSGVGSSERFSKTLSSKTVYYALKLSNGNIIRVASYQNTVFYLMFGLLQPIAIIVVVMLSLAAYMAKRLAKKITDPINTLDLDHPEENMTYAELNPLLTRIFRQKMKLKEQMDVAKQQQHEFKLITDHMTEGFVVVSKDLSILSYNESIKKHLGIIDDISSSTIYILNHETAFIEFVEKTMSGHHAEWVQEKDEHYYQWISNPVIQNEKVNGAVIVMIDITDRFKRDKFRRDFTANVSHELKTPLTSISGFAEIMQNGLVKSEDVSNFAGDIFKESQRLISLVNDIIRLSQLDDETMIYQKETVSIKDIVENCVEPLKASAKNQKVELNMEGADFEFNTVPSIFQEILFNLVDNAIKYNKENGKVDITYKKEENNLILTVTDTGIGISGPEQERVFERFYRIDKSRSSKTGGTGLGLSIVKHAVMTLNGKIELESGIHKGSKITVILPLN